MSILSSVSTKRVYMLITLPLAFYVVCEKSDRKAVLLNDILYNDFKKIEILSKDGLLLFDNQRNIEKS